MEIHEGGLDHPDVRTLLREHLRGLAQLSPPESVHALDLDALHRPDIDFWSVWEGDDLLGFGAIKRLDSTRAEIKSMRIARDHLRRGVGTMLLRHILDEAVRRGFCRLSLETGSARDFLPAHRLYQRFGFVVCGPFADYVDDPNSVFMSKELQSNSS